MATAKLTIKGYDDLKTPLNQSKNELNSWAQTVQGVGKKLESAFTLAAIYKTIQGLTSALKSCVAEYIEVEQVTQRLERVWDNVGKVTNKTSKQVNDYADSIEKTTYFTKEAVQESAILLAATEKLTDEGFDRALAASVDLAAALGEDVTSAASTLAKALEDPASALNRLKSVGITFTETEKAHIKALTEANQTYEAQSLILDKIEERYKDVAKAINDTPAGKLNNIKDTLADIRKSLGQSLLNSISPALDSLYQDLQKIFDLVNPYLDKGNFAISKDLEKSLAAFGSYRAREMFNGADFSTPGTTNYNVNQSLLNEIYTAIKKEGLTFDNLQELLKQYETTLSGLEGSWSLSEFMLGNNDSYSSAYARYLGLTALLADAKYSGRTQEFRSPVSQIETSANEIETAMTVIGDSLSDFEEFMKKYGNSTVLKAYEYQSIIDSATGFLDIINRYKEDIITGDGAEAVAALLGLPVDTLPGDILVMANELQDVIDLYSGKLEELNTVIESEAVNLGLNLKVSGIDPFGLNNVFSGLNGFGGLPNGLRFTDTFSLMKGSSSLTASDILELDKLFKQYASLSASYEADMLQDTIDRLSELIASYVDEDSPVSTYLSEILESLETQLSVLKKSNSGDSASSGKTGSAGGLFKNLGEAMQNLEDAADAVWEDFKGQIGEAGDLINRLTSNMAQFGPLLGAIVTALHYVIQGFVEEIGSLLEEFVYWGLEPLREFGRMIGEIITPILQEIMPSVITTGKMLMNLFGAIARVLTPIVTVLMKIIGPILTVLADVLVSIVGTISWAIDWIAYCITWVLNKVTFGWVDQTAKPGSLSDYVSNMMAMPGEGYESVSTTTGTNAAYSGMTNIYLNVYQNGTVVGEDGITEFALIIRNELADLAYYSR